jgi:molybdate transport system substrate-binding protein
MLRRNRSAVVAIAVLAICAGVVARAHATQRSQLTVYAAASLTDVLPKIDAAPRYSFGGSNMLAAQLQQGAPADVFAAANTALPKQLHAKGLCSKPTVFTRNALVVVVPKANPAHIRSVFDLRRAGVKLVVADRGVPVGDFTLQILKTLKISAGVEKNVVSRETDVREVLAKVALGEADAGFAYATDARTVPGRVKAVKVPARAQPNVQYGICIVAASHHTSQARSFVETVLSKTGQAELAAAGFLPLVDKR